MGVRVLANIADDMAVIYCSTSGQAFGPVIECEDAEATALEFLKWLPKDARNFKDADLNNEWYKFLAEKEAEVEVPDDSDN